MTRWPVVSGMRRSSYNSSLNALLRGNLRIFVVITRMGYYSEIEYSYGVGIFITLGPWQCGSLRSPCEVCILFTLMMLLSCRAMSWLVVALGLTLPCVFHYTLITLWRPELNGQRHELGDLENQICHKNY